MHALDQHPCFNKKESRTCGRVHLPVAPDCNVQCKFCNRKYDCVNESRPGVTSAVLSPKQALAYLKNMCELRSDLKVVGIAGPGDPFATPELTLETLALVRKEYPEMLLCVASNGLALGAYVSDLAALEVTHVTITINAVVPEIGEKVYRWFRDGKRMVHGIAGAELLIGRQLSALDKLKERGIIAKVNSILLPGINDHHIVDIAKTAAEHGADLFNCIPLLPAAGSDFEHHTEPDGKLVKEIRAEAEKYLPQMTHCTRCRADAVGLLGEEMSKEATMILQKSADSGFAARKTVAKRIAVASEEGVFVNVHLGNARKVQVYEKTDSGIVCVDERVMPPAGGGDERWMAMADALQDCHTVLAQFAGGSPKRVLGEKGIDIKTMSGLLAPALEILFDGKDLPEFMTASAPKKCGSGCGGNGGGCGA